MLTGEQIRAARAMLCWSQTDLANKSGVSVASIRRIEPQSGLPNAHAWSLQRIKESFQAAGMAFFADKGRVSVSMDVNISKGKKE